MKNKILNILLASAFFILPAFSEEISSGVFFKNLKNGDEVKSPFKVEMGVTGKTVHPAGELIDGTGHHHIVIDGSYVPTGMVIPADEKHLHFGKGQTEAELNLSSGKHIITLQFADGGHKSYGEDWSKTIEILVK